MPSPPTALCLSVSFEASKHDSRPAICTSLSLSVVHHRHARSELALLPDILVLLLPSVSDNSTFGYELWREEEDEEDACIACFLQSSDHRAISNWILIECEMPSRSTVLGCRSFQLEVSDTDLWNTLWKWFVCVVCVLLPSV